MVAAIKLYTKHQKWINIILKKVNVAVKYRDSTRQGHITK